MTTFLIVCGALSFGSALLLWAICKVGARSDKWNSTL